MVRGVRNLWAGAMLGCAALVSLTAAARDTSHQVQPGQTLWAIAKRYGVTVDAIRERNSLGENSPIRPGQKLQIPDKNARTKHASHSSAPEKKTDDKKANEKKADDKKADEKKADERKADSKKSEDKKSKDREDEKKADVAEPAAKSWVMAKPSAQTQIQKSAKERGINPCDTKDMGFGIYDRWSRESSIGQLIMPQRGGITPDGQFDVMFQFHGHEAVRKEWVKVMDGAVLVGIDLGIGSGPYSQTFNAPDAFKRLVESVEQAMAKKTGRKNARVRKVGLSSWSAGYGATQEIISQPYGRRLVDVVILLDGLHSGYSGNMINETQIKPFVEFAQAAANGEKFMFVSHSSIIPPGYASTTETANFLIYKVGGKPRHTQPRGSDPMGLDLISRFSKGQFHVRGYSGNDKMDHCAHIGLLGDVLKVHIKPRWNSPRGTRRPGEPTDARVAHATE